MAAARAAVGVAVLDGKLYALGSENEDEADEEDEGVISRTVERYDPATNAWEEVTCCSASGPSICAQQTSCLPLKAPCGFISWRLRELDRRSQKEENLGQKSV